MYSLEIDTTDSETDCAGVLAFTAVCGIFKKFSQFHASIFSKYKCSSVHKHIEEGICLPATDVLLSKNVTLCRRHKRVQMISSACDIIV